MDEHGEDDEAPLTWKQPTEGPQPTGFRLTVSRLAADLKTPLDSRSIALAGSIDRYDLGAFLKAMPGEQSRGNYAVRVEAVREKKATPAETSTAVAVLAVRDKVPTIVSKWLTETINGKRSRSATAFRAPRKRS